MKLIAIALPAVLVLAACGRGDGTDISITGDNGSAGIANGTARIDVPGFKGELRLPRIQVGANNLDINGAKLFPGSTVSNVDVNAREGADDGRVRISFAAPAGLAQVRDHFRGQLTGADFTVAADGDGLRGTDEDGKPFTLALTPAGAERTTGVLTLGK